MAFFDFFRRKKKDNAAEEAQTAPVPETTEAEAAEETELAAAETAVAEESSQALDDTLAAVEHALEQENSGAIVSESVADGAPPANRAAPAPVAPTPAPEPEAAAVENIAAANPPETGGVSFADVAEQLIAPDAAAEPSADTPVEEVAALEKRGA